MDGDKNVLKLIMDGLIANGIKVYVPGGKFSQAKDKYVVVKFAGSGKAKTYSTEKDLYNIMLYVPKNQYTELPDFESEVRRVLDTPPLFPMIMPLGQTENDYFDDNIDAHLRIIRYYNYRRNKHL